MSFNQTSTFGFGGAGGSGSGPVAGVGILQLTVGVSTGLVAGTSTYSNAVLAGKTIDYIVVGNIMLLDYGAAPGFSFSGTTINISPNVWTDGDAILIQYRNL